MSKELLQNKFGGIKKIKALKMKIVVSSKQIFLWILEKQYYLIASIVFVVASVFVCALSNETNKNVQIVDTSSLTGDVNGVSQTNILNVQYFGNFPRVISEKPVTPPALDSCLTDSGPLITLSGKNNSYKNKVLAENTKIDASMATFVNGGEHPVSIGGGAGVCWHSGKIYGGYPLDASFKTTHPTAGIQIQDGTFRPVIEGVYIDQIGDGIKVRLGEYSGQAGIAEPFTVRGVWLRDIRDDCIESDWQAGALIEDSLLDGCYVAFATKKRPSASTNGSNNTWEIRDTIVYLHDQIGVYKGSSPGHGMFFKWDDTSPKWKMYNSILRVDSNLSSSPDQFNFQLDKLAECKNNILVWLGSGPFPETVPSCFKITKDKAVWDNAVSEWKISHGYKP